MNSITINVANWHHISDKEVLQVVRAAINQAIKYDSDRTIGKHYWNDPNNGVELQIIIK